jgi:amino acid adenylation domain-containing protein
MADPHPGLQPVDFDPFAPARQARLPLTEPQAEMWAAAAMGREANCSYNQCFAFALHGPLRIDSLRAAVDQVIGRHEALRAVIAPNGTGQELRPPFSVQMPLVDLSELGPAERDRDIEALLEQECETPFDLAEGPLIRAFVVRESADRHRFVVTVHHIVCDGWSSSVLFADLGLLYAADRVGIPASLGPAASFRDYVADQTGPEHVAAATADEDYWAAQYPDGAPVLDLPLARARPVTKTYASGREHLRIGSELYADVKAAGATAGATLFATLLAAFEVLVHRLSGQSDFVVGIPLAGQLELENPSLVAHCVNTVPLRARLDPEVPFAEHLRTVRQRLARAQGHSRFTFGTMVRRLRIPRDRSRTPLVSITFTIDKIGAPFDFGDVAIAPLTAPKSYSNFELAINLVDSGSDIVVESDYNSDLFDGPTLRRWMSHYETVLRAIVARPDTPVGALPVLSEEDTRAILDEWRGDAGVPEGEQGSAGVGVGGCLHVRFEQWARLVSGRVAVVCDGESLTYGELDRRANALALRLRSLGVGREVLVGLRTERSLGVVVGILGILKAGGAYVPLDPAYPPERVQFMLADSGVRVVVTESGFVEDFAACGAELVLVDRECAEAQVGPEAVVGPEDLAYVMYTSGSTGQPKGVLISHRNVARLFDATEGWFGFGEDDVWSLFHSYAFDFSVWEMWGALLYGGRLVVVPYWVSRSPEAFWELVLREGVTVLNQTPSAFRQFIAADLQSGPALTGALRYVIFGGEALELASLGAWFDRHGDRCPRLVNMYGITETTVHVTYRPISIEDLQAGAGSVIGVPIPDLRVVVLDAYGSPVPIGVAGEMYVGGGGVSRGYLGRPELTAQRFVPDRFGDADARLYRTGDLARRLENGDLEYLGRIDDQVKIRGFRIELGEIEAVLARHPAVSDAVVLAREDAGLDKRLVAYVVAAGQPDQLIEQLKRHLRATLPEYMVPAHYVLLAQLSLTPNGKTDRKALPTPDYGRREVDRPYSAPRTPTEQTLADIWATVLGNESPGVDDDFFDVGGDSLMAAQIVMALRSAFGVDATMRHLFERSTIAGLAEIVDVLAVSSGGTPQSAGSDREEIEI